MTSTTQTQPLTDVHDMVVVHRAFRRELALLPPLVRAVQPGDTARASLLARHARLILDGLHLHHTGEDELLWPLLLERAAPSAELVHRMEAQHEVVDEQLQRLATCLPRWEAEARPAVSEEVADALDVLREALLVHLDEEEREILPLAARHVTPAEWARLGEHGKTRMTRQQLPLMFHAALEDATPEERRELLAVLPLPLRLLVRTLALRQYRAYVTDVRGQAPARW